MMKTKTRTVVAVGLVIAAIGGTAAGLILIKKNISERIEKRTDLSEQDKPDIYIGQPISDKFTLGSGDYDFSLQIGGLTRKYLIHIPDSYKKIAPTPLVLAFHGGGGTAEHMMKEDDYFHLVSKSDKEGFIVAFPDGTGKGTWNAGNCCGYARDNNIDDSGFVRSLISDVEKKFNINGDKVFAAGFSNGGMLTYRLACDLSDKFSAIMSVAGTDNYDQCKMKKPVSVLHIHAQDDDHVLFNGGYGPATPFPKAVTNFTSVPETISRWIERNKCDKNSKRVLENDGAYCDLYIGCNDNAQVKLCVTDDGGHSWPGGTSTSLRRKPSSAISATDEMWNFFKMN